MSRSRLALGLLVVITLSVLGYGAYRRYGAPVEATTATPSAPAAEAAAEPEVVTAEGKIVPAREADLAFRTSGQVAAVLVQEGQTIRAGEPLVQLWSTDLEAAVAQAEAAVEGAEAALALARANRDDLVAGARSQEIQAAQEQVDAASAAAAQAQAQLDQLRQGATDDQIAAAQAAVAQAEAVQKEAQIAYDRIIENIEFLAGATEEQARFNLNATNQSLAAARAALDQLLAGADAESVRAAQAAVWAAVAERDAAKAQLELLQAGPTESQRAAADAQVAQAEGALASTLAGLDAARAALEQTRLVAPFAGTVAKVNVDVGEIATPALPAVRLADLSHWEMETEDLSETDVVLVQVGQTATVTLDAFPDQSFPGKVVGVSSVSETNRGNVTYRVTIVLDPTDAPLRWGMTAFVDIDVTP